MTKIPSPPRPAPADLPDVAWTRPSPPPVGSRLLNVEVHYDKDARVWWADSEDIPGLVTEADTLSGLVQHVTSLAAAISHENFGDEHLGLLIFSFGCPSKAHYKH